MLKPNTQLSKQMGKKWSVLMAEEKNHQFSAVFFLLLTVFFYHVPVTGNERNIPESKKQVTVHVRNQLIATQCD